jgi:hypothetical protein
VRIECSLCGDQLFDLHLCLSSSVDARYILHTQPLGLYNKILVGYGSIPPCLSICPCWIIVLTSNTFCYHCMLSFHLPYLSFFYLINPYSFDDKRWDLQCQWPWQQQRQESTTSRVVVGHVDPAFRDHGANATCQSRDAIHIRKTPIKKVSTNHNL